MSTITGSPLSLTLATPADIVDVTRHIANNFDAINTWAAGIVPVSLVPSTIPSGNNCTAYNMGISTMVLNASDFIDDPSWALETGTTVAEVITFKADSTKAIQMWFRGTASYHSAWYRYMTDTVNNAWVKFGGTDHYSVNNVNTVIVPITAWTKVPVAVGESQAGADIVPASAGSPSTAGLKLTRGGVYQVEATVNWDGGIGAGYRDIGVDDLTIAAPTGLNVIRSSTSATEASIMNFTFTREFASNVVIGLWCRHNNTGGLGVSIRRLTATYICKSLI